MRKLIFHDLAKQELKLIRKYTLKNWGADQTKKYLKGLTHTLQLIKENPLLGSQKQDIQDNAFCFTHKSHMIYYQFENIKVVIAAVLHRSMQVNKHLTGRI